METPLAEDSVRTHTAFRTLAMRPARRGRPSTPSSSTPSSPLTLMSTPATPLTPLSSASSPVPTTPSPSTSVVSKKERPGKRNFTIFVDAGEQDVPLGSATQRFRLGSRVPLAVRSANSTPTPSPRPDDLPFPYSTTEFFEDDKENRDPNPATTPPLTPVAFPHRPAAFTGPPPPQLPRARIIRPTRDSTTLSAPRNLVLYEVLGLGDWHVSKRTIMTAWRQTALMAHPDRAPEDEREAATILMQQVNAAADVLSHLTSRRQYHIDGVLPWAG